MYYHFYPSTNNLNFSCRIKTISFSTGNIQVYAALFSGGKFLEDERLAPMYYPGDLPINSWTTFSVTLSSCPSFDMIILGAIANGDNVVSLMILEYIDKHIGYTLKTLHFTFYKNNCII